MCADEHRDRQLHRGHEGSQESNLLFGKRLVLELEEQRGVGAGEAKLPRYQHEKELADDRESHHAPHGLVRPPRVGDGLLGFLPIQGSPARQLARCILVNKDSHKRGSDYVCYSAGLQETRHVNHLIRGEKIIPRRSEQHADGLAYAVAQRGPTFLFQHCKGPSIHHNVLRCSQEVQAEHCRGEFCHVEDIEPTLNSARSQKQPDANAELDRDQPGFSAAKSMQIDRINDWRPEDLEAKRPGAKEELAHLIVRRPALFQHPDERDRDPDGQTLQEV
mmetsp:Transcript_31792/g.77482  ORF Transcript_31792/g.77482 Transcript_31792/m.77482 type:complete len:276 (+) Transcript_31792:778-1605(+)